MMKLKKNSNDGLKPEKKTTASRNTMAQTTDIESLEPTFVQQTG